MASDIDIAQHATMRRIAAMAADRLDIADEHLVPYGHFKAKVSLDYLESIAHRPDGRLILVTAISPTPAGEGKTTATIGLGDALNRIGKRALICLREPSMGPVFGLKGGAAGGGRAQVVPMEDINLHFTGDFAAIAQANNLLAALIDNHLHQGNALDIDPASIVWKRVLDMNDRALRHVVTGLGGPVNGPPREDGFDIVVASEVMAVFCLATSLADLKRRLGRMVIGHDRAGRPVTAADLKAHGAMTVLLRDALAPNLVQTLENNPALVHGGPFANIAHGCNSVIATRAALKLADYVVTEAGFGADLGAEKFIDIKCRQSGLRPDVAVLVATVRALKYQGGVALGDLARENPAALARGMANLERHLNNLREQFGLPCIVAINHYTADTEAELAWLQDRLAALEVPMQVARHWAEGSAGAEALARSVVECIDRSPAGVGAGFRFAYDDALPLLDKIHAVATRVYGAAGVSAPAAVQAQIRRLEAAGHGRLPVCVAKTPFSFSTDPQARGAPSGHTLAIREVRLAAGAGFVIIFCGDVMTMPGLGKAPAAERIDIDAQGRVVGLS